MVWISLFTYFKKLNKSQNVYQPNLKKKLFGCIGFSVSRRFLSCSRLDLAPDQGLNLAPLHCECRVLVTGPTGKSLLALFKKKKGKENFNKDYKFRDKKEARWKTESPTFWEPTICDNTSMFIIILALRFYLV